MRHLTEEALPPRPCNSTLRWVRGGGGGGEGERSVRRLGVSVFLSWIVSNHASPLVSCPSMKDFAPQPLSSSYRVFGFLEAKGAFHSTKTSGLNFGQFHERMEQHFSVDCTGNDDFPTFPKKRTTSRGIPKFSKKISRKFSFHSTLLPEFLKFSVE